MKTEFGNALVENMCTGCTCVVNYKLLELIQGRLPNFTVMHDFWIYLVGTCFGKVIYDEQSYILYRQHGNNELGAASTVLDNYKRRLKCFKKHRGKTVLVKYKHGQYTKHLNWTNKNYSV